MRRLPTALLLALLPCVPALAHPHEAPTLSAEIEIRDQEVEVKLTGLHEIVDPWHGPQHSSGALVAWIHEHIPVRIDGQPVPPVFREEGPPRLFEGGDVVEFTEMTLAYPCERRPRQVGFLWREFRGARWQGEQVVPFILKAGRDVVVRGFSPEEPEYLWHAPDIEPPRRRAPTPVEDERDSGGPGGRRLGAYALVLLALLCGVGLRRRPALAAVAALACAGGAGFLFRAEAAPRQFTMPSEAQAQRIFQTLQDNIYAAFDADDEDGIYDLLAVSVTADKLDTLYADVYESLILREQGGAVCQVEQVETVEAHVDLPPPGSDEHRFLADWKWRVHAAVSHWGHTHRRVNEYAALFTVVYDGRSWKIADVDVREQKRLDLDATPDPGR